MLYVKYYILKFRPYKIYLVIQLKNKLINSIKIAMKPFLNENQIVELNNALISILHEFKVYKKDENLSVSESFLT